MTERSICPNSLYHTYTNTHTENTHMTTFPNHMPIAVRFTRDNLDHYMLNVTPGRPDTVELYPTVADAQQVADRMNVTYPTYGYHPVPYLNGYHVMFRWEGRPDDNDPVMGEWACMTTTRGTEFKAFARVEDAAAEANRCNATFGPQGYRYQVITCDQHEHGDEPIVNAKGMLVTKFNDTHTEETTMSNDENNLPAPIVEQPTYEALVARCESLERGLADAESEWRIASNNVTQLRGQLEQAREHHREDIARIGEAAIEMANDLGWCSRYDDLVDNVNRDLHVKLPIREKDYTVTYTVTITVNESITAKDEDAAQNAAGDNTGWLRETIINAARNNNWDIDWDSCEASED